MAATINVITSVTGTVNGTQVAMGSKTTPVVVTLSSDILTQDTVSVANNTTVILWQDGASTEHVSQFGVAWVESSQDIWLELKVDLDNGVGDEQFCMKIRANVPFLIPTSVAKANYDGSFGGTDDRIERIRVRNESGSTAVVKMLILK